MCKVLGWPNSEGSGKWTVLYLEYSRHLSWALSFLKIRIDGQRMQWGALPARLQMTPKWGIQHTRGKPKGPGQADRMGQQEPPEIQQGQTQCPALGKELRV